MSYITINPKKLAKYIRENADVLAANATVDFRVVTISRYSGGTTFEQSVNVELSEIPVEAVQAAEKEAE